MSILQQLLDCCGVFVSFVPLSSELSSEEISRKIMVLLVSVTMIMQVTKKQGEMFMVILCIFVVYPLHGETKG